MDPSNQEGTKRSPPVRTTFLASFSWMKRISGQDLHIWEIRRDLRGRTHRRRRGTTSNLGDKSRRRKIVDWRYARLFSMSKIPRLRRTLSQRLMSLRLSLWRGRT